MYATSVANQRHTYSQIHDAVNAHELILINYKEVTPMSILQQMQQAAEEAVESSIDMTVATKGGGGRLYPEGYCFARLTEVIELGSHRQEFNGVLKDATPQFRLGFCLWGEGYQNEDGTPGYLGTYELSMSTNEKAKAFKLFKKLNYKGTAKTFAQLLNSPFLLKVQSYTAKAAGSKPRSIIDLEGFLPPNDPVTKQPYAIPDAPESAFKLFLWNKPTQAMWDSLLIEGTFDDGNSKNFIQETILKATDFPGSALEALLGGGTADLPSLTVPAAPSATDTNEPSPVPGVGDAVPAISSPSGEVAPEAPAMPSMPVTTAAPVPTPVAPVFNVPAMPNIPSVPK